MSRLNAVPSSLWFLRATAASLVAVAVPSTVSFAQGGAPTSVVFTGGRGTISNTVAIPANAAIVWTSGTVPGVADANAPAGSRARFGDTKTQAVSVLTAIEARLKEHGLGLKDVVYLRAYLVPDKEKGGTIDTQGWNDAYGQFFSNATNPTKPARSTVGVVALVNPNWLVEVEAFAVFPPQ
ncbi:MAG TPA: RidA family protein [Gemmatimonadaceae bacterium]